MKNRSSDLNALSYAQRRSAISSRVRPSVVTGALLFAAALLAPDAHAVGTRTFELSSLDDLRGGDLTGVSVDSNGIVRAGWNLGSVPLPQASTVWAALMASDGSVVLGTGNEGKVLRVRGNDVRVLSTTGQMGASSLALGWDNELFVGTFPEGKIFRVSKAAKEGAEAPVFTTLPDTEDIWGLAFSAKEKVLYAATGPEGKIYRIDSSGKAQVYFDTDEPHLVSIAVGDDGAVYAGSNGKALLYKITGPGRATVLYDFDADDVKAMAFDKRGSLFAIANKYNEAFAAPKKNKPGPAGPQPTRSPKPGKGTLVRFTKDGVIERMLDDDDTHYVSLSVGENGMPYVGTGAQGQVFSVDDNHIARLVADTAERQVGALSVLGNRSFVITSDPAVFHEVKAQGGADAVWTSKVLDAGLRAHFGRLTWRSEGAVQFESRSGNTLVPDVTWSNWTELTDVGERSGAVASPAARYVQLRARWNRDPKALLRGMSLAFVTDNARAILTSIDAVPKGQAKVLLKTGLVSSGAEPPKPVTGVKLSWKVDNPDQDELRYRISYRLENDAVWRGVLKPSEKLSRADYEWDTSALPEGTYRVMVEATDELSNPPERVQRHSLESGPILIDATPPAFRSLSAQGRKLSAEVVDGVGPIARIEVSIAGSDEWRPVFPRDGVFDQNQETVAVDLSSMLPAGSHLLAVRVYDSSGNAVTKNVEVR